MAQRTIVVAVLFAAVVVLTAGLSLFRSAAPGPSPEMKGFRYGTANPDATVTDCGVESERRYGEGPDALEFALGCTQAQTDAVLEATHRQGP